MNLSDIWDTPSFFYSIGYAISAFAAAGYESRRIGVWKTRLLFTGLLGFLLAFMSATRGVTGVPYVLVMLVIAGSMFTCIYITNGNLLKSAFYFTKAFVYGEMSSSLCWLVYYGLAYDRPFMQSMPWMLGIMAACFMLIAGTVQVFEKRLRRDGVELDVRMRDAVIAALTMLGIYVISNLGYLDKRGLFHATFARDIFLMRTLVDLSGACMLYAFHSQLIEVQVRGENERLQAIMETQYEAYRLSRESIELVNEKYHDLKHQIALLRSSAGSPKAEAWLDEMAREIQGYEFRNQTGNPVLDAVLAGKSLHCRKKGIELKCIADGALLSFMDDMELSALFGNMLDNALECVERIGDPQRRLVRLYVGGEKGFLRICIENTCDWILRFSEGLPVTDKPDVRQHGFGMKSMRRTVEKYGGSLVASQKDGWFALRILIPIPNGYMDNQKEGGE